MLSTTRMNQRVRFLVPAVTLSIGLGIALPAHADVSADVSLVGVDVSGLQELLESGAVTSVELVEKYVARIAAYDDAYGDEPGISAIIAQNPAALREAEKLDAEREDGEVRGPLHGIPVLVKDNIDVAGMPTTAGSAALAGFRPADDATVVTRLKDAGAIVLAKTNLHEFAAGITTISSEKGQTRNPYDQSRDPGGSSGGTGAGVASGFAPVGLGTDTSGSIRIPAAHDGLVGVRPTVGLSTRDGVVPLSVTEDTVGPMTTTVRDAALLLDATVGPDPKDVSTAASEGQIPESYVDGLSDTALDGATVGLLTDPEFLGTVDEMEQQTTDVVRAAVADLEAQGARVVELSLPASIMDNLLGDTIPFFEGRRDIDAYLAQDGATYPAELASLIEPADALTLADLLASKKIGEAVLPTLEGADQVELPNDQYSGAMAARTALQEELRAVFTDQGIDALAYPSLRRAASPIGQAASTKEAGDLVGTVGFPAVTVPAGSTADGLPVGLELMGLPYSESQLLGLAYDFEQATHHRVAPASVPALPDDSIAAAPADDETDTVAVLVGAGAAVLGVAGVLWVVIRRRRSIA